MKRLWPKPRTAADLTPVAMIDFTVRKTHHLVDLEYCHECHHWGDHGTGFEQCYHKWCEENENRREENHEDR